MSKGALVFVSGFVFSAMLSLVSGAVIAGPILREDDPVVISGLTEHWKLVWQSKPSLVCVPDPDDAQTWYTCPCEGFAYGEAGTLDLVRNVPGKPNQIFPLTPLFADSEIGTTVGVGSSAILEKWPVLDQDRQWWDTAPKDVINQISKRKPVRALQFRDFNRDGQATEFLLQVDTAPCGKDYDALIGVTQTNPKIHVFGTAEHPDKPLLMYGLMWEQLLKTKDDVTVLEWACGDHASGVQREVLLHTDAAGIHATEFTYACDHDSDKGTLKSKEAL